MPRAVTSPTGQMLASEAKPTNGEIEDASKLCYDTKDEHCSKEDKVINEVKEVGMTEDEVEVEATEEPAKEIVNGDEVAPVVGEGDKKEAEEETSEVKEDTTTAVYGEVVNDGEASKVKEDDFMAGKNEEKEAEYEACVVKENASTNDEDQEKGTEEEPSNVTEQALADESEAVKSDEKGTSEEIATPNEGEVMEAVEEQTCGVKEDAPTDGDGKVVEESEETVEVCDGDKTDDYPAWDGEKADAAVSGWPAQYGNTDGQEETIADDKGYEEWNGAEETTADEEEESEILMLDDVKETLAKITSQLEEDQDNSDLKVLAEFTEEYEKMSETQISLQQKLTTVLAETNALWQEFEKYRPEYAKVMWDEKKEERQKGQTEQTWSNWDAKDKGDWKGNWKAAAESTSGDGQESWKAKKTWTYKDADDNVEQEQEGGWKSNDAKTWDDRDKNEGDQSGWKANGKDWSGEGDSKSNGKDWSGEGDSKSNGKDWSGEGDSKSNGKDWGSWGKEKATKNVSWRDAEGGSGESAEWHPQSGGRRGYDNNWEDKEQQKGSWGNDKEDWKDEGDKDKVEDKGTVEDNKEGKASYDELEAEVVRLRKAVAENEKALATAAPPSPPPAPEPAAPVVPEAVQLPPPPPPAQPQPQQDGLAIEEMTEKITKDIEDRLKSQYKAEMAELEMRHYKEMQTQMRYIMQQQQQQRSPSPPREYGRPSRVGGYHGGYDYHPEQYSRSRPHALDDRYAGERMLSPFHRDGSVSGMSGYAARSPTGYGDARESPTMAPPPSAPPRDRRERKLSPSHAKPRRPHQPPNVDRTTSRAVQEPRAPRPTYYGQTAPPPVAPVTLPEPPRPSRSPPGPLVEETLSVDNAIKAYRYDGPRGGAASSSYRPSELNTREFDGSN